MVESSETSPKSGKRSTKQTAKLTPDEALQILQAAAANCQQAGISVRLAPIYEGGVRMVAIVVAGAELINGNLVTSTGKGAE